VRTGTGAFRTISSATLPVIRWSSPDRPAVPTTIVSTGFVSAKSTTCSCGTPWRTDVVTSTPSLAAA
jgi:hypothetical protein